MYKTQLHCMDTVHVFCYGLQHSPGTQIKIRSLLKNSKIIICTQVTLTMAMHLQLPIKISKFFIGLTMLR